MFPIVKNVLNTTTQVIDNTVHALEKKSSNSTHIAFLSITTPLTIPLGELARLLVVQRGITGTFISLADNAKDVAHASFLASLPSAISHETIPSLPLDDLLPAVSVEHRIATMASRCVAFIAPILEKLVLTTGLAALVVDFAVAFAIVDIVKALNIPLYVFATSNMNVFCYCQHLQELEKKLTGDIRSLTQPIQLPGCIPINPTDFFQGSMDIFGAAHKAMLTIFSRYKEATGILINSFVELEQGPYKALKDEESRGELPPIFPVGPVISRDGWGDDKHGCLKWLDGQPNGSVIYIAFGSIGSLTLEQITELAAALEQCGHRFIWVVRTAIEKAAAGVLFDLLWDRDHLSCLPSGFVERTKGRGLVVPIWAPQVKVLKHPAVGGFITHCGWSSVLESISCGVPMIAWPLFAEQRMNATLLSEGKDCVGVALRAQAGEDGVVRRDVAVSVIKELMEGQGGLRIREKVKKVQAAAAGAHLEGGTSHQALTKWCGHFGV